VQSRDGVVLVDSRSCGIKPADKVIVSPVANARPGLAVRQRSRPSTEARPNSPDRGQSVVAKQAAEPESHVP